MLLFVFTKFLPYFSFWMNYFIFAFFSLSRFLLVIIIIIWICCMSSIYAHDLFILFLVFCCLFILFITLVFFSSSFSYPSIDSVKWFYEDMDFFSIFISKIYITIYLFIHLFMYVCMHSICICRVFCATCKINCIQSSCWKLFGFLVGLDVYCCTICRTYLLSHPIHTYAVQSMHFTSFDADFYFCIII